MSASAMEGGSSTLHASHLQPAHSSADIPGDEVASISYQSAQEGQLLPPPNFRPFFTLIEDSNSGEHHHPTVHYYFADDDPEGLTSAVLDSIQPAQQDTNHRLLLVDIGTDGRSIASAHSLDSTWQICNSSMVPAPSWTGSGPEAASEGLMLKIEGHEAPKQQQDTEKSRSKSGDILHRLESDVEAYMERLGYLQNVLAKAETI